MTSQSVAQSQQTHDYSRLEILYQAHSAEGASLSPVAVRSPTEKVEGEIIPVSAEFPVDMSLTAEPSCSIAELRIEYPHPEGRPRYARVSLRFKPVDCGRQCERLTLEQSFEARTETQRERREVRRERWFWERLHPDPIGTVIAELDLSKAELDILLAELDSHGFFTRESVSSSAESKLEVRLNRGWTSKPWRYEPVLDELTTRAYEEGRIRTVNESAESESSRWLDRLSFGLTGRSR